MKRLRFNMMEEQCVKVLRWSGRTGLRWIGGVQIMPGVASSNIFFHPKESMSRNSF